MKSKSAKAKKAPRKIPIAPSDGTDMFSTQYSRRASIYRLAFHKFVVERGIAAAVVTEQCTKPGHLTMYLKICALLVLMPIFATAAFAVDDKKQPPQQGGFLTGTPEEQAACAPDSTKFLQGRNSRHVSRAGVPARTPQKPAQGLPEGSRRSRPVVAARISAAARSSADRPSDAASLSEQATACFLEPF